VTVTARLMRRRSVPVPTGLGCALAALVLLAAVAAVRTALPSLHAFLAPQAPVGRGLLVVEGWVGRDTIAGAARIFAEGRYEKVLTTGAPIESLWPDMPYESQAELAAFAMALEGVPADRVFAVPTPASAQDRTFLSAVMVREFLRERGLVPEALDVVSEGTHARRSWRLYRVAFGADVEIGVIATPPRSYEADRWWQTTAGAKSVLTEAIGLAWVTCCFDPGPPGSRRERWAR
jgi:hypothetical protein